jgi:hypothetical protein
MPSIAVFEVTLRNAAHNALAAQTGTDWWFQSVLNPQAYNNVISLINDLTRRYGNPPTIGKVLSETTLGFWVKLFAKRYNPIWLGSQPPFLLSQVLANYPNIARDSRAKFEKRLEYFLTLRNRIMHQEAVFDGVRANNRPRLPIEEVHTQLIETLGWIDADAAELVACLDRFDDVFAPAGRTALENDIKARFQIP